MLSAIDFGFLWLAFIGLFAIINPFSTVFVFLGLTEHESEKRKRFLAKKATITCAIILVFFMVTGTALFKLFNITIEAFRIAGGLIIMNVGFAMLRPKMRESFEEHKAELKKKEDISIIPLAIPMLSGPGAIATALVWTSQSNTLFDRLGLMVVVILISIIAYIFLRNAKMFKKALGKTGTAVTERLMGLIVLVMGVQFIINALMVIVPQMLG
jgi:multiple antibiotic resistance protein